MASILTVLDGSTQTGNVLDLSPSTTTWTVSGYTYRDTGCLHAHTQHGLVPWFRLLRHSTAWPTAPTRRRHQAWPRPARCPSPRPPTSAYATSPTSRAGASRIGLHLPHANVHLDTTAHTSPVQDVPTTPAAASPPTPPSRTGVSAAPLPAAPPSPAAASRPTASAPRRAHHTPADPSARSHGNRGRRTPVAVRRPPPCRPCCCSPGHRCRD